MSVKKDPKDYNYGKPCVDHLGNHYKTVNQMALTYDIPPEVYHSRIKRGWSVERALTTPVRRYKDKYAEQALKEWEEMPDELKAIIHRPFDGAHDKRLMDWMKRRAGVEVKEDE